MLKFTRGCVVVALALLAGVARVHAQFGLPAEVTQSATPLTDAQKAQLDQHLDAQFARIQSKELDKVKQAQEVMAGRRAVIEPLTAQASVPFRLSYAEKLEPRLKALIENGSEMQQVNALVISAELGTNRSLTLIAMGRTNAAASIRFQAAAATRRFLDSLVGVQSPAVNENDLKRLLQDTANAMTAEKDPQVTAGQIAALSAGLALPSVRQNAADRLGDAVAGIACRAKGDALHPRVLESVMTSLDGLRGQLLGAGTNVPAALSKATADVATSCLAHVRAVIAGQKLSAESSETAAGRKAYAGFAGLAQTVLQLSGQVSVPKVDVPNKPGLAQDIESDTAKTDADAVKSLGEIIDAAGAGFKVSGDPCKRK
ncbi:MAG: hypothetical protein U0637_04870 [Phycisphaerales bacterium]